MHVMARYSAIVILSCVWRCTLTSSTFWQNSPLVSSCRLNNDHLMHRLRKDTPGACALECHAREWCNSFQFTSGANECILSSLQFLDADVNVTTVSTKYYRSYSDKCSLQEGFTWDRRSGMCLLMMLHQDLLVSSWQEAVQGCANRSLRLVSLTTAHHLDFLTRTLRYNDRFTGPDKTDFFLGASRPTATRGQPWPGGVPDFQWLSDGSTVDTANTYWVHGEPDNRENNDNVLVLKAGEEFRLADDKDSGARALGYVCEK